MVSLKVSDFFVGKPLLMLSNNFMVSIKVSDFFVENYQLSKIKINYIINLLIH